MGQFKALLIKNWILYKRGWVGSLLEILIPVIFVVIVAGLKKISTTQTVPEVQFLSNFPYQYQVVLGSNNTLLSSNLKSCTNNMVQGRLARNGIVGLSPPSDAIISKLGSKLTSMGYSVMYFNTDSQIDALARSPYYGDNSTYPGICFAVSMQASGNHKYSYKLRYNISTSNSQGPDTKAKATLIQKFSASTILTSAFGMMEINNVMLNYIIREQLGDDNYNSQATIVPMKQQTYVQSTLYDILGNSVDFLLLIPLLIVYLRQTSSMLEEKEKKIRETMKIMGMTSWNYYATWFIRYFAVYLVIHAIATGILTASLGTVNGGVIFITFILFDILLIIQSFFVQVFFTKAKLGMVIALIFFILQYVINFVVRTSDSPSITQNTYASISAHSAFVSAFQNMIFSAANQFNLGFSQIATNVNNYEVVICWISFIGNIIFWLLLTMYLEQVYPNEWGAKKSPFFCFQCPSKVEEERSSLSRESFTAQNVEDVEVRFKEMANSGNIIKIRNVTKTFDNGRKAVDNLSMNIYSDQIFVLLGHNGAGKTTTISMLTGMLDPSEGVIEELGLNSRTDMNDIRKQMGICPQHDTLYDDLTVKEHLELFGTFKGFDSGLLDAEVHKLIESVNLEQKTDYISKNLSGGQKRRLSVAMAFVGGSKLIYLDQPTSGMDTTARRFVWQMMKDYKSNRIIILTTHFMDQADFLGDRIGIMSDGKLICAGSSIYLKNKYGVGYNITISKLNSNIPSHPIVSLITKHVASAKVTTDVSTEISLQLPMEEVPKFAKMFQQLDSLKQKLGYQSYGVSITTLEQVFLKVAEVRQDNQGGQFQKIQDEHLAQEDMIDLSQDFDIKPTEDQNRLWRHMRALWIKRFWVTIRDYKNLVYEFLYPIGIIIAALFVLRISFIADRPAQTISWGLFGGEGLLQIPISGNDTVLNNTLTTQLNNDYSNYMAVTDYSTTSAFDFDNNVLFPKKTRLLKGGIYLSQSYNSTSFRHIALINTQSPYTPFLFPMSVATSIINSRKSASDPPVSIEVINAPLPVTSSQLSINNTISGFLAGFIFSLALAFKFSSVASFLVKQREDRCKYQQIVSGMSIYSYWLGNFIFDYAQYFIVAAFAAGMCSAFDIDTLVSGGALGATWILFVLYGMTNLPLTYIASFIFKDYSNAQAAIYFFNFVSGGILTTIILLLRFIGDTAGTVARGLAWALRLIPAFSFGEGLVNLGSASQFSIRENKSVPYSIWNVNIVLGPIIMLIVLFFVFFGLLFLIEYLSNSEDFMRFFSRQKSVAYVQPEEVQDNDVVFQSAKALDASPSDYAITTKNLRKVYILPGNDKHKVAVDKLSFTVEKGEVFGLLGVNGAGKTTTFKMLAGEVGSTDGQSYLNGIRISENLDTIRKNLGYCPQFDALLEGLSVRQQLNLYYDLKMLPSGLKDKVVNFKIKQLNLGKYADILSGTLSGGNKRKLSVACALIGNPSILFLDEPSTGMDPEARRFMWRVISQISTQKKQATVILTTHSMEEAEALSTRLGIMVKGNFKCIGTPQHLKSKFGQGYEIEVKLVSPSRDEVTRMLQAANLNPTDIVSKYNFQYCLQSLTKNEDIKKELSEKGNGKYIFNSIQKDSSSIKLIAVAEFVFTEQRGEQLKKFIESKFETPQILQHFEGFYRFRLKSRTPISKIFMEFQSNKDRLLVQQYSIKQATVEQIFNKFAAQYEYNEDD